MNIELDEVVVQDVSDDALEQAAGGAQGGSRTLRVYCGGGFRNTLRSRFLLATWLAIADR